VRRSRIRVLGRPGGSLRPEGSGLGVKRMKRVTASSRKCLLVLRRQVEEVIRQSHEAGWLGIREDRGRIPALNAGLCYNASSALPSFSFLSMPHIPRLFSIIPVTSITSPINLFPAMKSTASRLSSVPCSISRWRLCVPPRGKPEGVEERIRG